MWELHFPPDEVTFTLMGGHDAVRSYLYCDINNDTLYNLVVLGVITFFIVALCLVFWSVIRTHDMEGNP